VVLWLYQISEAVESEFIGLGNGGFFTVYFDESGKLHSMQILHFSFCGYVGHVFGVVKFFAAQVEQLSAFRWQVPSIHMSPHLCKSRQQDDEWKRSKPSWGGGGNKSARVMPARVRENRPRGVSDNGVRGFAVP